MRPPKDPFFKIFFLAMGDAELLLTGDALTLDDLFSCSSGFRNVNIDPSTLAKVRRLTKML